MNKEKLRMQLQRFARHAHDDEAQAQMLMLSIDVGNVRLLQLVKGMLSTLDVTWRIVFMFGFMLSVYLKVGPLSGKATSWVAVATPLWIWAVFDLLRAVALCVRQALINQAQSEVHTAKLESILPVVLTHGFSWCCWVLFLVLATLSLDGQLHPPNHRVLAIPICVAFAFELVRAVRKMPRDQTVEDLIFTAFSLCTEVTIIIAACRLDEINSMPWLGVMFLPFAVLCLIGLLIAVGMLSGMKDEYCLLCLCFPFVTALGFVPVTLPGLSLIFLSHFLNKVPSSCLTFADTRSPLPQSFPYNLVFLPTLIPFGLLICLVGFKLLRDLWKHVLETTRRVWNPRGNAILDLQQAPHKEREAQQIRMVTRKLLIPLILECKTPTRFEVSNTSMPTIVVLKNDAPNAGEHPPAPTANERAQNPTDDAVCSSSTTPQPISSNTSNDVTSMCISCFMKPRTTALLPCGHAMLCTKCVRKLLERDAICPTCKVSVQRAVDVSAWKADDQTVAVEFEMVQARV